MSESNRPEEIGQLHQLVQEQRNELKEMRRQLAAQEEKLSRLESRSLPAASPLPPPEATSRRRMLKKLAAGAAFAAVSSTALAVSTREAEAATAGSTAVYGFSAAPDNGNSPLYQPTSGAYGLIGSANRPTSGTSSTTDVFAGVYGQGPSGVYGLGTGSNSVGVQATGTTGVYAAGPTGVFGDATAPSNAVGVRGDAAGTTGKGVQGTSSGGIGVQGNTASGTAVQGISTSTGIAVQGTSTSGIAVQGTSASGIAVQGTSTTNTAVQGNSTGGGTGVQGISTTGFGVLGQATGNGSIAVYGLTQASAGNGVWGAAITTLGGYSAPGDISAGVVAGGGTGNYSLYVYNNGTGATGGAPIYIQPGSGATTPAPSVARPGTGRAGPSTAAPGPAPLAGPPTTALHFQGEIVSDIGGRLYYCVADGIPGTWGQLAPIVFLSTPLRILGAPNSNYSPGTFEHLPDGSIAYYKIEGSWTDNNPSGPYTAVIPHQASAILATVSTVNTTNQGYLTVYPANVSQPVVATMGFGPGFVTSNSITVKLGPIPSGPDAGKQGIAIFTYSNGAVINLALDVVGYYL